MKLVSFYYQIKIKTNSKTIIKISVNLRVETNTHFFDHSSKIREPFYKSYQNFKLNKITFHRTETWLLGRFITYFWSYDINFFWTANNPFALLTIYHFVHVQLRLYSILIKDTSIPIMTIMCTLDFTLHIFITIIIMMMNDIIDIDDSPPLPTRYYKTFCTQKIVLNINIHM